MASPSDLWPACVRYQNLFWLYGWQTLWRTVAGLAVTVVFGTLLGMGPSKAMNDALYPLLVGFNAIPKATVVPAIALMFAVLLALAALGIVICCAIVALEMVFAGRAVRTAH